MTNNQSVEIFKSKEGDIELQVNVENESVWLNQKQLTMLFGKTKNTISEHINNVFKEGELIRKSVVRKFRTTAADGKTYNTEYYNLDVIISVGYRVKSKQGTQFRMWATNTLRQHLVKGYTINEHRLEGAKLQELRSAVSLIRKAMNAKQLTGDESAGLLKVITDYTETWTLLDQYDKQAIAAPKKTHTARYVLDHGEALKLIAALKKNLIRQGQASELFGREKDDGLKRVLGAIRQTFDSKDLYATVEEKAAHLLYFLTKDHPFIDGNKRIAAFLFIIYLTRSQYVNARDGERKFNDSALVALVLLVAESQPRQKELLIRLVMNFVNGKGR